MRTNRDTETHRKNFTGAAPKCRRNTHRMSARLLLRASAPEREDSMQREALSGPGDQAASMRMLGGKDRYQVAPRIANAGCRRANPSAISSISFHWGALML